MREDLLHFIWKFKKFCLKGLTTQENKTVQILDFGSHNHHSGPDFLNAKVAIANQLWVGNVEIHLSSSDWYLHKHHLDRAYNNVILHVVWKYDRPVMTYTGEPLPTLVLSHYVDESILNRYHGLLHQSKSSFINCEHYSDEFSLFLLLPWMEHLYRERLDQKSLKLSLMLKNFHNDWEKLLFTALLKNFGQRVNGQSFESLASSLDFNIVRKLGKKTLLLESILFGLMGILQKYPVVDPYHKKLLQEFIYMKKKYKLAKQWVEEPEYMGVRPSNFPTIRLSQFAVLYTTEKNLFSKIIEIKDLQGFYDIFQIRASRYWDTHYVFGKKAKEQMKVLSKAFIDSLIINTITPIAYLFAKMHGKDAYAEIRGLLIEIRKESNHITDRYISLGFPIQNALDSQAFIQLYDYYCSKNRCLECALGNQILN